MNLSDANQKSYFEYFDVEESFIVDIPYIRKIFEEEQNKISESMLNPANAHDMQNIMNQAVSLNEAYNTLSNPHARALYLIKINGFDISKENPEVTPGFRMASMNIMSALEEAEQSDNPYGAFREVLKRVSVNIENICRDLEIVLDCVDDVLDWESVAASLNELDFYLGIQAKSQKLLYDFLRESKKKK